MADYGTVVGYFNSQSTAEAAIQALKSAGFQQNQIGVAARNDNAGIGTSTSKVDMSGSEKSTTTHGTGMWDKVKSFFEGGDEVEPYAGETSHRTFDDREITPPAYGSDDVHDSLHGLSVPEEHARYFGHRFSGGTGGAIVTVTASGREEEAATILKQNGGDLGEGAASYDYDNNPARENTTQPQDIRLYGEVLRVQKERVSRGEVRLRKEVVTTMQTVEVPVTREELVIDRVPVTGEHVAEGSAFSGEEIRIPLSEERASVDKQAVLREQVRVGKKEVTNLESFKEEVRNENLKVDQDSVKIDEDVDTERAG